MWVSACKGLRVPRLLASLSPVPLAATATTSLLLSSCSSPVLMEKTRIASFSASAFPRKSDGGRGRGSYIREDRQRPRGGGRPAKDKIDALGRLLDGYVEVHDLLKLNMKTIAVQRDNKQRFSLMEENGELFIRVNQGHTAHDRVCVHGTYKKNLDLIFQSDLKRMKRLHVHFSSGLPTDGDVISGMRRNANVLIFLDVRKALEEGMKLHISDNKEILAEGFDATVPVKFCEKIETWPDREPIPF
ncbi:hypothetical protein NE237_013238 [Protea cynaroides]|uniref:tRNA 2'-phosphotransferase 1 n=1 Tax=Protea cynaroides TaxID=273540 RepID=A0A9Q0H1N1_9MAGN|nr:hypothetical protein NE237_013238 [Protea cynaroides]